METKLCYDVDEKEEKENGGSGMRGFSKFEVTVIDSSCSEFVYRKKISVGKLERGLVPFSKKKINPINQELNGHA